MFFESSHSLTEHEFRLSHPGSMTFPLHIHRSFEYFEQAEGMTEVVVGEHVYRLEKGDAVLVFPLQPHSYRSLAEGRIRMCIFSPDLVADFYKKSEGLTPAANKFRCALPAQPSTETVFHQKSLVYLICGEFDRAQGYIATPNKQEHRLLIRLLLFAEQNFASPCLLRDAAAEIGYDYAYASKFFKHKVGMSFRRYINGLRIIKGKQLLKSTEKTVEEIGEACGFASLRAFDREFRAQTGRSPSEYRKSR